MRKTIITTCLLLSALLVLDSMNAAHAIMMFLLAGEIPGTSLVLSAAHMMELFSLLIGFVVARIANTFVFASKRPSSLSALRT